MEITTASYDDGYPRSIQSSFTNPDGTFSFRHLPPGDNRFIIGEGAEQMVEGFRVAPGEYLRDMEIVYARRATFSVSMFWTVS